MKIKANKLKREAMPFIIAFLLFDIIVIGAICAGIHEIPEDANLYISLKTVFSSFLNNIITFKFFVGIFLEFGTFLNWSFGH